MPTLPETR